jgi:two-component system heavy metal sensor histidine kinase CusS
MASVTSLSRFNDMRFSVRAKLTLLYSMVTFGGLVLFGMLTYGLLHYALIQGKRKHLEGREERLISFLAENAAEAQHTGLNEQLRNYALVTHEGNLFHIKTMKGERIFPLDRGALDWSLAGEGDCHTPTYNTITLDRQPALVMCHAILLNGRPVKLYIGGALDEEFFILSKYRNALFLLLPGLLLVASCSGYFLSRHALKPVDRMTKAALEIGVGNLSQRLPVPAGRDEIQTLAIVWNQLLERLEAAVSRLSRFSADASHDIRTSITVMLATSQLSLNRHRSEQEYRQDLEKIVTECRTATTLLDALLTLSQSDNFMHEVQFRKLDLCELVVTGCRRVEDLAESSGIMLDWSLPEQAIYVDGDEILLQRLLGILLDNAIRYTPQHGEIRAEVTMAGSKPSVTVRDTGVGMTEDVRRHVFERFYQADLREGKSRAGNGLGLSIGRWIADAHGADLTVASEPLSGSAFTIQFPYSTLQILPSTDGEQVELSSEVVLSQS